MNRAGARCNKSGGHPSERLPAATLYDRDGNEIGRYSDPAAAGTRAAGQDCMLQLAQWLYWLPAHGRHQLIGCVN